jgi:CDP-diacylglycerol--glycerol-3-phosphate 3-phosphatidyltransferase
VNPIHANKWMLAITLAGIIGTYLVSYARARAEALGINAKVGVMQRAERVALLCAPQALFGLAFDGWVLIGVVVLLSVSAWHTAIHRINHVRLTTQGNIDSPIRVVSEKPSATGNRSTRRARP